MKHVFAAQSFWSLMLHSTFLSKCILLGSGVALFLVLFLFFYKYFLIREYRAQLLQANRILEKTASLADLVQAAASLQGTQPGRLLQKGLHALKKNLTSRNEQSVALQEVDAQAFSNAVTLLFNRIIEELYYLVYFLSVSAAVAPLVGLFGTITGLIQSFMAIGRSGSADLASVAPGIAEALLTTFGGLVVAIPAFILFHVLVTIIKSFEFELDQFVVTVEGIIESQVVECAE